MKDLSLVLESLSKVYLSSVRAKVHCAYCHEYLLFDILQRGSAARQYRSGCLIFHL